MSQRNLDEKICGAIDIAIRAAIHVYAVNR